MNATYWVQEFGKLDRIDRGLIQKRKVYNDKPMGMRGIAFNMRKAPFDDIRLRRAMSHLLNRPLIVEKLLLDPTERLKALPDEETQVAYTEAVNRLFSLRTEGTSTTPGVADDDVPQAHRRSR